MVVELYYCVLFQNIKILLFLGEEVLVRTRIIIRQIMYRIFRCGLDIITIEILSVIHIIHKSGPKDQSFKTKDMKLPLSWVRRFLELIELMTQEKELFQNFASAVMIWK